MFVRAKVSKYLRFVRNICYLFSRSLISGHCDRIKVLLASFHLDSRHTNAHFIACSMITMGTKTDDDSDIVRLGTNERGNNYIVVVCQNERTYEIKPNNGLVLEVRSSLLANISMTYNKHSWRSWM
jgi:hypothetical protein